MDSDEKTGLVLTGGGARAAYQAGVMHAIARILADAGRPALRAPFDIICGTSAGALNATALACRADDIERLQRINQTLERMPAKARAALPLRRVALLVIAPSERLDDIALRHVHSLPAPVRTLLGGIGTLETRGAALASYLLFEGGYTRELIRLGEHDTLARRDDVLAFFAE